MTSKRQQWRIPLKTVDSGQNFFDISVNTGRICMGLETDTPGEWQQQAHCMRLTKFWLKVIDGRPKNSVARQ